MSRSDLQMASLFDGTPSAPAAAGQARKKARQAALFAATFAVLASLTSKASERVALVVGNANYSHAPPLANPGNDAEDMAAVLRRLGFSVTLGTNLGDAAMEAHLRAFSRSARAADVALFFYAGHGLQVDGVNYLVPTDARLAAESDLPFEAISLDLVLKGMGGGTNLAFLDACRDNPFTRAWAGAGRSTAVGRGLGRVNESAIGGLFIAFATDPNSIAADGDGRNSPFTAALKEHIETAGLEVNGLLTQVRRTVLANTRNAQRPWSNSSLNDQFYFVPPVDQPAVRPVAPALVGDAPDPATELWLQIRETRDPQLLERYLATYPGSPYALAAQARLAELRGQPFTVAVEPSGARVRILNIEPPYRAGMQLPAGQYRVEASAKGHETQVETVTHGSSPTRHRMALRKVAVGPKIGERFRDCAQCPQMVVVPAGSFLMGSRESEQERGKDEGPVHRVRIVRPFAIGVYEVTFAEWDACEADGGCGGYSPDDEGWGRGRRPVINVSWDDAQAYVRWLSAKTGKRYRLPSESEWEYAARAGTRTPFSTGETISTEHANYDGNYTYGSGRKGVYRRQTVPVGAFGANAWGLHDAHGNAWEWVQDCWNGSYAGAPTDGSAWESGDCSRRVLRGGSWYDIPGGLRSASRIRNSTAERDISCGFRMARTLTP